jgi:hypothetical protein
MELKVRCCCQPDIIYGTLDIPDYQIGMESIRVLSKEFLEIGCYEENVISRKQAIEQVIIKPYSETNYGVVIKEYAVFSEERPRDFWRNIIGFKENIN